MDHNQDQVRACSQCGWPFANPRPSCKQRHAHKNICGTIEGYKLLVSDDDDDPYSQGPNSSDIGKNVNIVNVGTVERLSRSGDEVFLDAIATFSDGAPSSGTKQRLPNSLVSATDVEIDVNQLIVKATDDSKMLQDPTFVHNDDYFDLSSASNPVKAEGTPDMLLENKIHAGENDEIKSDSDMFEIAIFSDNAEGMLKIEVSDTDVVNSDSQVASGAFNLEEENNNAELLSMMLPQEELSLKVNSIILSTNGVQVKTVAEESIGVSSVKFMTESDKTSDEIGEDYMSQHSEKPSSGVYKSDEMDTFEKCDVTDAQYTERLIVKDSSSLPEPAGILLEVVEDFLARTLKDIVECANKIPLSGGIIEDNDEINRFISTSDDSHQTQDDAEEPGRSDSSLHSLNVEPSAQCVSVVVETQEEHVTEVSGTTVVPVQENQSGNNNNNNNVQLPSSAIHTSTDYGIQFDSLEGNRNSVSGLPSNLKDTKAASERQQCEKPEMVDSPSFMTLVEVQKGLNQQHQHPSSTTSSSQAGWFPTLTQVTSTTNESQGRKNNEEIIAKITNNRRSSKQHTPLQSPLRSSSNKTESQNSIFGKNGESAAAAKAVKGSNSSADMKRQNKKVKSITNWIPYMCCSSVESPRR